MNTANFVLKKSLHSVSLQFICHHLSSLPIVASCGITQIQWGLIYHIFIWVFLQDAQGNVIRNVILCGDVILLSYAWWDCPVGHRVLISFHSLTSAVLCGVPQVYTHRNKMGLDRSDSTEDCTGSDLWLTI